MSGTAERRRRKRRRRALSLTAHPPSYGDNGSMQRGGGARRGPCCSCITSSSPLETIHLNHERTSGGGGRPSSLLSPLGLLGWSRGPSCPLLHLKAFLYVPCMTQKGLAGDSPDILELLSLDVCSFGVTVCTHFVKDNTKGLLNPAPTERKEGCWLVGASGDGGGGVVRKKAPPIILAKHASHFSPLPPICCGDRGGRRERQTEGASLELPRPPLHNAKEPTKGRENLISSS